MTRKKILCVDDSPTSIMWQRMILGHGPYEIVTASDGAEGVERAMAERPDLILMDVTMPRMDGFQACKAIRSSPMLRQVPVIFLTTRGEEESVKQGFASGATDFLTKPIDRAALLEKVNTHLMARAS